jgi:hypothetical protein
MKRGKPMLIGRALALVLALLASSAAAPAQVVVSPPPVNQEGMQNFCIFASQIYSLGAQLCVPGSNVTLRCASSEGSKSGGRAFWSFDNKEWLPLPSGRCEPGRQ